MRLRLLVAAGALLSASLAAHADTYQYTVIFSLYGLETSNATFTTPDIITSTEDVSATGTANFFGAWSRAQKSTPR